MRLAVTPDEANSPLIIYAHGVLTSSIALERFKAVARRNAKLVKAYRRVKVEQFTAAHTINGLKSEHGLILKQRLGIAASK